MVYRCPICGNQTLADVNQETKDIKIFWPTIDTAKKDVNITNGVPVDFRACTTCGSIIPYGKQFIGQKIT